MRKCVLAVALAIAVIFWRVWHARAKAGMVLVRKKARAGMMLARKEMYTWMALVRDRILPASHIVLIYVLWARTMILAIRPS